MGCDRSVLRTGQPLFDREEFVRLRAHHTRAARQTARLQGNSTAQLAEQLVVSRTPSSSTSRACSKGEGAANRDLVGKFLLSYYEPQVRDNERRAIEGQPLAVDRSTAADHLNRQG